MLLQIFFVLQIGCLYLLLTCSLSQSVTCLSLPFGASYKLDITDFSLCSRKLEISAKPIPSLYSHIIGKSGYVSLFILSNDDNEIMLNVIFISNLWNNY